AMYIQDIDNVYDLEWVDGIKYGELFQRAEEEHSFYSYDYGDIELLFNLFNLYEKEARRVLEKGLVLPAYDYVLKCSHVFNLLEARGAISVTERTGYIARVRALARQSATEYLKQRESAGFPLMKEGERS
ncbi:MAG: glycine--tRNA ligase subunit alpha, partial [Firmicutes bacterium]|nr:glycine--tRNA ligase subunit alpha [Bacillota bacterium]